MKHVFSFGNGVADGSAKDKNLLGGKGANLSEMTNMGIPVPPGFTISTDVCKFFMEKETLPEYLEPQVQKAFQNIEFIMSQRFGCKKKPLLVSVRSGARQSMPGMMETVLNIGITSKTIPGLIKSSGNEKFVYDAYRRLIMMYSDVVIEKKLDYEFKEGGSIREKLESILNEMKRKNDLKIDSDLSITQLKKLCNLFKEEINKTLGEKFPDDPYIQLWGAVKAVFKSWNGKRAINYRKIENIPNHWGTAVNIQAMVFGNRNKNSATGVGFTRDPSSGENTFYGEWLPNAQGEDVVAGIRTPNPLNSFNTNYNTKRLPTLNVVMPQLYAELDIIQKKLERHYTDMQDIEFTIDNGKLWMLQTRTGKRNGHAAVQIAIEMLKENLIDEKTAINRIKPEQLDEIMHPMLDKKIEKQAKCLTRGLPAGPGGASGQIVFTANDAEKWHKKGKKVILVRNETSPEDVHGMYVSEAILTDRGGITSHAALVARGWGKCCVVGCSNLKISLINKTLSIDGSILKEGDWITLNGSNGNVYKDKLPLIDADLKNNKSFQILMKIADKHKTLNVRTNADSPSDAKKAREFGAKGIGLCRTEHMFFDPDRIVAIREMIIAKNKSYRRKAIMKLLKHQKKDFYGILKAMAPYPVTIRLLDPPLHEFLPNTKVGIAQLSKDLNIPLQSLKERINNLHEVNPMLGHRGCRLGISYPEITEMQVRAIFEASIELIKENYTPAPEIMIPLVSSVDEFKHQKQIIKKIAEIIKKEKGVEFNYHIGTMIELPRACATADQIAKEADFFSFGTNDLTQTTYGFSRDDIGSFLPKYLKLHIIKKDPFQSIDKEGVGSLLKMGIKKGKSTNQDLKIGVCGEHGGDPESIDFFHKSGLDYISCSPFRVPIARLAAAQSELK
ncbi:MAG: pyruvate, phosphate dikinase [Euryarchaeota archaeon]|nr:pyruvate, phosphate dikinase [Euryarchaeota archaeon]